MTQFNIDKRDIQFVLFDQLGMMRLTELERYQGLTREDFEMVIDNAERFITQELGPTFLPADDEGCTLNNGEVRVPESYVSLYKKFAEQGLIAVSQSPEYGGMGLPTAMAIVVEEMGIAQGSSFMFYPGLTVSAAHLIENHASDELKKLTVERMYTGEWTGTMCLTEPQAGTFLADIKTTATPVEGAENTYKIKGNKIYISAGDHQLTDNIVHLVLARVPGDPEGTTKGISLFAVPKRKWDAQGKLGGLNDVAVTAIEHKMGINASATCALSFGDEDDCEGYLIGERRKGLSYMFQMMNEARIACGVQGVALGAAAYERALTYAKERVQGTDVADRKNPERVAIIDHPDVRRNLMFCKAYVEGMRAMLLQASFYADYAHNHPDEKARTKYQDLLDLLTPICKAYATDKGFKVTELAIQIHGGYGYVKEYAVEQCMRDVKIASIYEGTNGVQALDLLGRKMTAKGGALYLTWLQETNTFLQSHSDHERLGDLVGAIDKAKNKMAEIAFGFAQSFAKDPSGTLLSATPFLEIFGHVEVGRLLLEQAIIADNKLNDLFNDKGADTPEARRDLIKDHADARFFDGKVKTAQFFVHNILPQAFALARAIKNGDRSALDIVF